MGEEDITIELLAEKIPPNYKSEAWDMPVKFVGRCLLGCKGRRLLTTKNMVTALAWVEYHREGLEHVSAVIKMSGGNNVMLPTDPPKSGIFTSSNGEETQP